ncbi:MAG: hypothetical protein KIT69_21080 [Propionibacteriaceae bacterium]|nr:hypothetical protein [Propionibacteriaceae bacterium]
MENLMRIREPLAWAIVVLSALLLVYQGLQIAWYMVAGIEWYQVGDSVAPPISISWIFGWQGIDYVLMLVLFLAVAGCWIAPAVARARTMTLTAAWIASVAVALPWAVVAFALLVSPLAALASVTPMGGWGWAGLLYPLITTGVGAVAAIALWALARRPAEESESSDEPDAEAGPAELDEAEAENPTVWKPAEATGTVWRTADEAAAGAPGVRSLESGETAPAGAEWAEEAVRPEPGTSGDWRPPTSR